MSEKNDNLSVWPLLILSLIFLGSLFVFSVALSAVVHFGPS